MSTEITIDARKVKVVADCAEGKEVVVAVMELDASKQGFEMIMQSGSEQIFDINDDRCIVISEMDKEPVQA